MGVLEDHLKDAAMLPRYLDGVANIVPDHPLVELADKVVGKGLP